MSELPKNHHPHFTRKLIRNLSIGLFLIFGSLYLGMLGYHHFEKMPWIDAFVNAAMILSGMGPLTPLNTNSGKIFAGIYAIYSGLILITSVAIMAAPIIHRFFRNIHIEFKDFK